MIGRRLSEEVVGEIRVGQSIIQLQSLIEKAIADATLITTAGR
jgi:hypothetical protein